MAVLPDNASTQQVPSNNLPVQPNSFIGREVQIDELVGLLSPDAADSNQRRLLTIASSGGAGKTRLSLEVAGRVLNRFADGVWLVELAPLTEEWLVEYSVARVLGVYGNADSSLLDTLTTYLQDKQLLIILDNCEHLVAACRRLAQTLLNASPRLQILATSREALSISGETVWPLPPLSMPGLQEWRAITGDRLAYLGQFEAVQLFVARATAIQPDFRVSEQNAPALIELCQRLDGLPLTIELAAARIKLLTVEQIVLRLKDVFNLLNKGNPNRLPHQQTLRALIDWSYRLLSEPEKSLLQRLAIFVGGGTLEAARLVCQGDGLSQAEIGDLLQQLANKSLAVVVETADHEIHFHLLETIRQYALEALNAGYFHEVVSRQHSDYFLQLAEEAEPKLRGSEQKQWLQRLEQEHDNLRAALHWLLELPDANPSQIERGVRLASALWWFWWRRGHLAEGRRWLETALAKSWIGNTWLPKPVTAKCKHALGGMAYHMGDYDLAKQMWEESLKLKTELGDKVGMSYALNNLGEMAQRQAHYRQSVALHEESLSLKRETGDRWGTAYSLNELGTILQRQGEYVRAKLLLEEGLLLFEETGHRHGVARSYHNLGKVAVCLGEFDQAAHLHEQSQAEFEQLAEKSGVADAFDSLGMLALYEGNYPAAKSSIERSLNIFQEVSDRWGISYALNDLGLVALGQGDYQAAASLFKQSLEIKQKLKDKESLAWTLEGLAITAALTGLTNQAAYLFGAVEQLRARLGTPVSPPNHKLYQELLPPHFDSLKTPDVLAARQEGSKATLEQAIWQAMAK